MDELPDHLVWDILKKLHTTNDRNSLSLSCKRFYYLDNQQRSSLRVGCGLNPVNDAVLSLCRRFPNLTKVEIVYSDWMATQGRQLGDQGLLVLSTNCHSLTDLTLTFCSFITDVGISHLSLCKELSSLKLDYISAITGRGLLALAVGCSKLKRLHLIRCINVGTVEWLECFGERESLEELCIKNIREIRECDLFGFGNGWRKLRSLHFEANLSHRYSRSNRVAVEPWRKQLVSCDNLVEVILVNCISVPGRGLACVLRECVNLEKIILDMCIGVSDSDIVALARKAKHLRSISLSVPCDFTMPFHDNINSRLTDESLNAIAQHCSKLEYFEILFNGEFPSVLSFTLEGLITLVQKCPIRELILFRACFFNDVGMEALCSAQYLKTLELSQCQEVSDEGLILVSKFPSLSVLRLSMCLGMTDDGFRPLVGTKKLELLEVEDCPQISRRGVRNVAKSVSFRQDLSWMY